MESSPRYSLFELASKHRALVTRHSRTESLAASPRRLGFLEEVFAVPFTTVDLPDGLAERPICPDCEGMMRLVWIAADKQHQDRHTFGARL